MGSKKGNSANFSTLKKNKIIAPTLALFLFLFLYTAVARAQSPHISGTVKVNVKTGLMECDLEVSNLPRISGYSILLNTGFNIRYFRDSADKFNYSYERYYNDEESYEAFQYYFPDNSGEKRYLPSAFKISYTGAFPVMNDTATLGSADDWKGNIAFNGSYGRATEQSAWYPVVYDTLNEVMYDRVTYDLKVIGEDGQSTYINGSVPMKGAVSGFRSALPVQLLLFSGKFDFVQKDKTWFINTSLSSSQQELLSNWCNRIISFYESKVKITYGCPVTFIEAEPVSKHQSWMFVTYPSIAVIGRPPHDMKGGFVAGTSQLKDSSGIKYYSHELGHYYFGTCLVPNANLRWLFLEGLTEYISLQSTREILGESDYKKTINYYLKQVGSAPVVPLHKIKQESQIDETYRYCYIPLLLTVLEKQVGKDKVWNWLNTVANSKNVKTNYAFFRSSLLKAGITEQQLAAFENTYIKAPDAKTRVINSFK